ncbi:hypothetical protein NP493_5g13008 [Ridgeia piscesae]|uniref:Large ribosomal subunit protein mL38 n=1 Tax=Ridgeia piscesae TaxID=27915 RepID=A0AAD9PFI6_RIDPI|nr:hypothetical protein NP493_5g13008 [Ridgeia piscesae]
MASAVNVMRCCSCRRLFKAASDRLFVRNYSIVPPDWLGGNIGKQLDPLPLEECKNFQERMEEMYPVDPELSKPVNIGVDCKPPAVSQMEKLEMWKNKRSQPELEQAVRLRQFEIPLDTVKESWLNEWGPLHKRALAEHYGIYRDLFSDAFFVPVVDMKVLYDYDDEFVTPVHSGNTILPSEARSQPQVMFESGADDLWTLVMTNPDGHLTDNNAEYLHWMVGNIPGGDVSKGQVLCNYLRPFPPKGTGFHRHIFVLFKQSGTINLDKYQRPANCTSLKERTFRMVDFYKDLESQVVPMGLAFFQSEWDSSVKDVYHNILDMREPSFEYVHPQFYHPLPVRYPHRQPFDRYYDRYRDKKELAEEVMKIKMKMVHPFKEPEKSVFPLIHVRRATNPPG